MSGGESFAITFVVFLLSGMLALAALWRAGEIRSAAARHWKMLALLLLLNVCLKLPIGQPFFHGIEYEDCYVHQAVARQLPYGPDLPAEINPFREAVFSLGSLDSPSEYQHFYNYIGYPVAIRLLQYCVGDKPVAAHLISLGVSCLNVILVFLLAFIIGRNAHLGLIAAFVYTSLPIENAYAATSSADVMSSGYVALLVLLVYLLAEGRPAVVTYSAVALVAVYAVLTKRENIVLIALLPVVYFLLASQRQAAGAALRNTAIHASVAFGPALLFMCLALDLTSAYGEEFNSIGQRPFSLRNFASLAPVYLASFAELRLYLVFGLSLLAAPVVWFAERRARPVILLLVCYIGMYSMHYRGYYFLLNYEAGTWDAVRYELNVVPLVAVLSATCIMVLVRFFDGMLGPQARRLRMTRALAAMLAVGVMIPAAIVSLRLRRELTEVEQQRDIRPSLESLAVIKDAYGIGCWNFTYQPCLFQTYGPRDLRIADLSLVDSCDKTLLPDILATGRAFALLTPFDLTRENINRYPRQMTWAFGHSVPVPEKVPGMNIVLLAGENRDSP